MKSAHTRSRTLPLVCAVLLAVSLGAAQPAGQGSSRATQKQPLDVEYTNLIKKYTQDPRISTELVDHMPASDKVPSPLKFFGRIPGTPDELTYAKDIHRYYEALDKASDRIALFNIGKTEEGRDMVALAVADEATIRSLDKYKEITRQLTDPRKITEAQAEQLIATGKPIYWITSGMHSGERGGPEMLIELPYRLAIQETAFIQTIRNNVITLITPVIEVDGRERMVDLFYYNKTTKKPAPNLVYWGQYVAHDNNRDGMGQALALTQNTMRTYLDWHPTVLHDLHEAQSYLYASTGTGPYNVSLDPIVIDEWWMIAKTETSEMAKRGVPGVFTYGFYDGWVPNYLFFIANSHNSIGRFYEVESYGPGNRVSTKSATQTSREWYRANPPLPTINWGPRNNTNIQQSALLIALNYIGKNRELFLENYYLKNKRAVEKGKADAPHAYLIPAGQRRKVEAANFVNMLRKQGAEIHTATTAWSGGGVSVQPGDYIARMDQPFRTLLDMYLDVQTYPPGNPRPYDDTGWTLPYLYNIRSIKVNDKTLLDQPMTLMTADARVPGAIMGTGSTLLIEHHAENPLATFRFRHKDVRMLAAQAEFEAGGRRFPAGTFIIPNADRAALEPSIKELSLAAMAVPTAPTVATHELDVPRIGYVHSWRNTQDEGWVRLAFDHYKIPYDYFGDQKLRDGNLRAKYDVIVFPHTSGSGQSLVGPGLPSGGEPTPWLKSELTPHLGFPDSTPDTRITMGWEGLQNLIQFVREGGTLIVEGSTTTLMPEYRVTQGITIEEPDDLFVRGSILKALVADRTSPIAYGYTEPAMAVYFSQGPVLNVGGGGGGGRGRGGRGGPGIPGVGQNITPNATEVQVTTLEGPPAAAGRGGRGGQGGRGGRGGGRGGFGGFGGGPSAESPRVVLEFPDDPNDLLLSGSLVGGDNLTGRAIAVDAPVGKGHVVMFANRPYWRWQTHGTFFLGFNAILNWNDLDAGRGAARTQTSPANGR